jgi:subtilase family serine protease
LTPLLVFRPHVKLDRMGAVRRAATFGAVVALGLSGALTSAIPASARQGTGLGAIRAAAGRPALPQGTVRLGTLTPGRVLHLDVMLKLPDPGALTAFIAAVGNPSSPRHGQYLRRGQFGRRFGPSLATVAAVEAWLRTAGLSPGRASASRLAIPVTATAASVQHAFGISLARYRLAGGRVAYANTRAPGLAASVAPFVSGVLGLDDLQAEHSNLIGPSPARVVRGSALPRHGRVASNPKPCIAARSAAAKLGVRTASQLASLYRMSPLYGLGDLGGDTRVALYEAEPYLTTDIASYEKCYGVHTVVTNTPVDGGAGPNAPKNAEAAIDIEDVLGLAPQVTIDVYTGPDTATGIYDTYSKIVADDRDRVISTSWGLCEPSAGSALVHDEQAVFEQAATQGQNVFASAGNTGSTGCYRKNATSGTDSDLAVSDPASQPYVVGVGGTQVSGSAESAWNASASGSGAGGGGLSGQWCMPGYQYQTAIPGLVSASSQPNAGCPAATGTYLRQVPDVSADAAVAGGYALYWKGKWGAYGGTSLAAPLWAAAAALIDASPFCTAWDSGKPGVQPEGLYAVASQDASYIYGSVAEALSDITSGNNDYTPSGYAGGLYPATPGYDLATGLGSPLVSGVTPDSKSASLYFPGLAALMCEAYARKFSTAKVTGISPHEGPLKGGQKVTITGSGFIPAAGADIAVVGSTDVSASCSSTTRCTLVTPKGALGAVHILMDAEDLGLSPATSADRYQYVAPPTVTSLTPARGSSLGGTRVTITGTSFLGQVSVRFGRRAGVHVAVVSPTKITVTTPGGSGTVTVRVTADGGTVVAGHFRY